MPHNVLDIVLIAGLVLSAVMTVMASRLLVSVICLAVTSVFVTLLMFRLNSPIAGVFELSVCAGLIPAIFLSTISLTARLTPEAMAERKKEVYRRFWLLPVLVVLVGLVLTQTHLPMDFVAPAAAPAGTDVRTVLWTQRHLDVLGQVVVLLGGAIGVVILVKEPRNA